MNRFVFHIILLLISFAARSQNLIYNGSFEEYSSCPQGNELNNGQFERAVGWYRPTMSTPDYYNRCNTGIVSIPDNFWGYQEAFQGDGYIGFGAISWNDLEYTGSEYVRTKLLSTLKPCVEYKFCMYVNLANESTHGVGKIGVWFSQENDYNPIWTALTESPQVVYGGSPISDTAEWIKIEGTFVADGFEEYLTIGYFNDDVGMDTTFIQEFGFGYASYFYVDSVSLIELKEVPPDLCSSNALLIPNVITPNNDGINDVLDLSQIFGLATKVRILNRWGNTVKVLDKENPAWDGSGCTAGVYYYIIDYAFGDKKKQQNGFIQLVR